MKNATNPSRDDSKKSSSHIHTPKYYAEVCSESPLDYSDYENLEIEYGFQDDYEVCSKLGRGRYSEVFKGVNLLDNQEVVIKILKPGKLKWKITYSKES